MRATSSSTGLPGFSFSDPDFNNSMEEEEDYRSQLDVFEDETDSGESAFRTSSASRTSSLPSLGFLTNRPEHPIDTVLENRSWMGDDDNATQSSASKTDDDEFRAELERLNLSEREVSQEIVRAMEAFQYARTNNKPMVVRHDLSVESVANDTRESSASDCPSDEACGSIVYEVREPPEAVEPRTPRSNNNEQQQSTSDSTTTSSGMQHVSDDPSADLMTIDEHGSLKADLTNTTSYEQIDNEEDEVEEARSEEKTSAAAQTPEPIEQWEATPQRDIECGNGDIFEEESFWEDGLWKTPVMDNTKVNDNEWSESEYTQEEDVEKRSVSSRPNVRDLAQLYLPNLKPPQDTNNVTEVELEVHSMSESEEEEEEEDTLSNFQDEIEPAYWDAKREPHEILEDQLDSQHSRTVRISVIDTAISDKPKRDPDLPPYNKKEEDKSPRRCWSSWRILLVIVHIILFAVGTIVLRRHLKLHSSSAKTGPLPANDECSLVTEDHLLLRTGEVVFGTTLGATSEIVPCSQSAVEGVWYRTIGTGEAMTVTASSENGVAPNVMLLSGSCGNLQCEGASETSSVHWFSEAETLYHIFLSGERADFSLQLEEKVSMNSKCAASTALLLSEDEDNVTISSQTSPSIDECHSSDTTSSWFTIPGNGKFMTASICNVESSAWANNDVYLTVLSGSCQESACALSLESSPLSKVDWVSVPGESYQLVAWNSGGVPVSFDLCFVQAEAATTCESAIPTNAYVNDKGTVEIVGSTRTEMNNGGDNTSAAQSCGKRAVPSTASWYTFEGSGDDVTATTCDGATGSLSAIFDVFSGPECNTLACVSEGRTGNCGASGQQFLSWTTDPGQKYWIAVYGDIVDVQGNFTLDLSGISGTNERPSPAEVIPMSQQVERKPTSQIIGICILVIWSVCGLFALIAWRWRRLKRSDGAMPQQNRTKR